jgi:hypothetical protein
VSKRNNKPLDNRQLAELLNRTHRRPGQKAARAPKRADGYASRLEARYAEHLTALVRAGEIAEWWYDTLTVKLAPNTHHKPDFLVQHADGTLAWHEVKGFWRDDALVKSKITAAMLPLPYYVCRWGKASGWVVEQIEEMSHGRVA